MDDSCIHKAWDRPWSTEEMRAHCSSWNLAGDAGLLKHLQEFSQNLLQKTHLTEVALDSLLEEMRNTSVDVQNASNALFMLSNNQFVENRVYDDCEDEKEEMERKIESKENEIGDSDLITKVGEAIQLGLGVIDTQFDCMEVPASDSEAEEDLESPGQMGKKSFALVLEPKNPYLTRPLPYLIGTKEFMEDERIGLGDEEEEDLSIGHDLATHGMANDSGSSFSAEGGFLDEVEQRRGHDNLTKQSWESSSSGSSDVGQIEDYRKKQIANETAISSGDQFGRDDDDIFGKYSASEDEIFGKPHVKTELSVPVKKDSDVKELAEELAAKLRVVDDDKRIDDSLTSNIIETKSEVVKERKSKTLSLSSDNLFGPPKDDWNINEDEDAIFSDNDGMFSSNGGLFDDINEPTLESKPSKFSYTVPSRLPDKPPPFEKDHTLFGKSQENLFGEGNEDDRGMFGADILSKKNIPNVQDLEAQIAPKAGSSKIVTASSVTWHDQKVTDASDSWLFNDKDEEDPFLKNVSKDVSLKQKVLSEKPEEEKDKEIEKGPKKKLPIGAQSFYVNGVDPFALGKKVVKELQDKNIGCLVSDPEFVDPFNTAKVVSEKEVPDVLKKSSKTDTCESGKEANSHLKPASLFEKVDEEDLFTPITSKSPNTDNPIKADNGNGLFVSKKSSENSTIDSFEKTRKGQCGADTPSKGLFGDSGSDDEDIFSCSSSIGSRSSKVITNRHFKSFDNPSIFGNDEDADIFSGTMGSQVEKKKVNDLFQDFGADKSEDIFVQEENVSVKKGKDVDKVEEPEVDDLFCGMVHHEEKAPKLSEDLFSEKELNLPKQSKKIDPEDLFSDIKPVESAVAKKPLNDLFAPSSEELEQNLKSKKSSLTKKSTHISDDIFDEGDIFSLPIKKEDPVDDIFGDFDDKVDINNSENKLDKSECVINLESDENNSIIENMEVKTKRSIHVFHDSKDNLFRTKNLPAEGLHKESDTLKNANKRKSRDLFSEFGDDDSLFSSSIEKEERKSSSIFVDPLTGEDDLFSTLDNEVKTESTPNLLMEEDDLSEDKKSVEQEEITNKNEFKKVLEVVISEGKTEVQPITIRKSPPRTLNLGKVIPSPKLSSNIPKSSDDFFGTGSLEDDKIVQAWMKGHPPPLRESKVENTAEDLPGCVYGATKGSSLIDDIPYFGDIPTSALLHSHGKERARIQGRRRPPSRKIRKSPTAPMSSEQYFEEEVAKSTEVPSSITSCSKSSIEEDNRSQETIEEWSTPEAGLVSPPSVPPRSNPLSPSTDEEQDFFDVLPVGRYPPPMAPPELSPFTDVTAEVGMNDNLWDKQDSGLFEDAGDLIGRNDSLWASPVSGFSPSIPPSLGEDSLQNEVSYSVSKEPVIKSDDNEGDLFEDMGSVKQISSIPIASTSSVRKDSMDKLKDKGLSDEKNKISNKVGPSSDLWGEILSSNSSVESDLFSSKGNKSMEGSENIFEEEEDLFNSSKMSSKKEFGKTNLGITVGKNIGKSFSQLPPKAKQGLFDDDDDDEEDLFSSRPIKKAPNKSSAPSQKIFSARNVKEQKTKSAIATTKSGSSEDLFEDPLMVLKRKE